MQATNGCQGLSASMARLCFHAAGHGNGAPAAPVPPAAQQQPTVETTVVGSIAATDFSSVAGLGE